MCGPWCERAGLNHGTLRSPLSMLRGDSQTQGGLLAVHRSPCLPDPLLCVLCPLWCGFQEGQTLLACLHTSCPSLTITVAGEVGSDCYPPSLVVDLGRKTSPEQMCASLHPLMVSRWAGGWTAGLNGCSKKRLWQPSAS